MQVDDFFIEAHDSDDPWGVGSPKLFLRADLLNSLRSGPLPDEDDLSTAIALTRLVHGELESYGTDGTERLNNDEISVAQRSLRVTLERRGIRLSLPWRDYSTFRGYWLRNEASGSRQARRDILSTFFDPVFEQLYQLEEAAFSAGTAVAVSPHTGTGLARSRYGNCGAAEMVPVGHHAAGLPRRGEQVRRGAGDVEPNGL